MLQEIGQLVTAVGVVLAWLSLRANNRQRRRQFETIYVQRYWTLMDRLSPTATSATGVLMSPGDRAVARAYLRLCEDELELRAAGWITNPTWSIWQGGMNNELKRKPFSVVWEEVERAHQGFEPNQGEFRYLRRFKSNGEQDPLSNLGVGQRLVRVVRPAP